MSPGSQVYRLPSKIIISLLECRGKCNSEFLAISIAFWRDGSPRGIFEILDICLERSVGFVLKSAHLHCYSRDWKDLIRKATLDTATRGAPFSKPISHSKNRERRQRIPIKVLLDPRPTDYIEANLESVPSTGIMLEILFYKRIELLFQRSVLHPSSRLFALTTHHPRRIHNQHYIPYKPTMDFDSTLTSSATLKFSLFFVSGKDKVARLVFLQLPASFILAFPGVCLRMW